MSCGTLPQNLRTLPTLSGRSWSSLKRPLLDDHRLGHEAGEHGRAAMGADGGAVAALGCAEGLVQHEHAGIEAELGGAELAHEAVEVGMVPGAEAARLVHVPDPVGDLGIVDAHVVRIADHERRIGPHGAGAEEADPRHAERFPAQMEEMPKHVVLAHLGQRRRHPAGHAGRHEGRDLPLNVHPSTTGRG